MTQTYIAMGAAEARRRGHRYVGTEHVVLALVRDAAAPAARLLQKFNLSYDDLEQSQVLVDLWSPTGTQPPPNTVNPMLARVLRLFERTSATDCIAPRLQTALQRSVERAGTRPLRDEDVLVGILAVPDSLGARALNHLGVTLGAVEALAATDPPQPR
jgi:ATP-dependent Clp protease ATP-binding subunit ClpC